MGKVKTVFISITRIVKSWDWLAIIITFIAVFTFWLFNTLNREHTANIKYPLDIRYENPNIIALIPPPEKIDVNITGKGWSILKKNLEFNREPIPFFISSKESTSIRYINIKSKLFQNLIKRFKDVKVNYVLEDSVACSFDTLSNKNIYFHVDKETISLEKNHKIVSEISIDPEYIQIIGPSSILPQYSDTILLKIDQEQVDRYFNEEISFEYEEKAFVTFPRNKTTVYFDVVLFVKKKLPLKIKTVNFGENINFTFLPPYGEVIFYVNSTELLQPIDSIEAIFNFNQFNTSDSSISPQLILPKEFHDAVVYPEKFIITFRDSL